MKYIKKQIFICLLFTTSFYFAQSNFSGIIQYESYPNKKKVEDLLKEKRKKTKNKKLLALINSSSSYNLPIKSKLKFTNGKGVFFVEDKMSKKNNDLGQSMAVLRAGGSKEYYYNLKENIYLIKECEALGECFIFGNKELKWTLTQESKTINNFVCYKATRNHGKVIAWYTPEIPIGFGPKGEFGLPGLILELEISKIIFKAKKIVLNPKEKIKVEEPKGGKHVTYDEYSEIISKAKKSVFGN